MRNKARLLYCKNMSCDSDEEFTFNGEEGSEPNVIREVPDNSELLKEIVYEMLEFTRVGTDLNAINLFLLA